MNNENTLSNFIPISRKIFTHPFWIEKRTYSKAEAWVDLIQLARYEDTEGKVFANGRFIIYYRAEIPASVRFLCNRWKWGMGKLTKYLDLLRSERMIDTRQSQGQTIIKIFNYELYNKSIQQRNTKRNTSKPISVSLLEEHRNADQSKSGTKAERKRNESNIDNTVKKEESVVTTQTIDSFSEDQRKEFNSLSKWITENTPTLLKMDNQITIEEFIRLKTKRWYSNVNLMKILAKMDNWKGIEKKNKSVYKTAINWAEREFAND